jgi:hypothetical protein
MKYHVTHCGGCGALMLCDKSACTPQYHLCYSCVQAGMPFPNASQRGQSGTSKPLPREPHLSQRKVSAFDTPSREKTVPASNRLPVRSMRRAGGFRLAWDP